MPDWNRLLPFGTLMAASVLPAFVWLLPGFAEIMPNVAMPVAFFWLAYAPRLLPTSALLIGGLAFDVFSGGITGMTTMLYIIMSWVLQLWRKQLVSNQLLPMMLTFAVISAILHLIGWLLMCYVESIWLPLPPIIIQFSIGVMLYPPLHIMLGSIFHSSKFINEQ